MIFLRRNKFLVIVAVVGLSLIGLYRLKTQHDPALAIRNSYRQTDFPPSYRNFTNGNVDDSPDDKNEESEEQESEEGDLHTQEHNTNETIAEDDDLTTLEREGNINEVDKSREKEADDNTEEELENTLNWVNRMGRGKGRHVALRNGKTDQRTLAEAVKNSEHTGNSTGHARMPENTGHVIRYKPIRGGENDAGENNSSSPSHRNVLNHDVTNVPSQKFREISTTTLIETNDMLTHDGAGQTGKDTSELSEITTVELTSTSTTKRVSSYKSTLVTDLEDKARTKSTQIEDTTTAISRAVEETLSTTSEPTATSQLKTEVTEQFHTTNIPQHAPTAIAPEETKGSQGNSNTNSNSTSRPATTTAFIENETVNEHGDAGSISRDFLTSTKATLTAASTSASTRPSTKATPVETSTSSSTEPTSSLNDLISETVIDNTNTTNEPSDSKAERSTVTHAVTFYTPTPSQSNSYTCKLPKLNPWDPSIRHLVVEVGVDPGCRSQFPQPKFKVIGNRLVAKQQGDQFEYVSLETINRDGDDSASLENAKLTLNLTDDNTYVSNRITGSDFIKLRCKLKGKQEERHYFARVVPNQDIIAKSRELHQEEPSKGLPLNVLMLGIDSTSHANFLRKMPHTLQFLRNKLSTYVMDGFSIVGDATTPALTALLTGNFDTELPEARRGHLSSGYLDNWPWVSKEFESRGYATLYAEDDPSMSTFNLRLNGFDKLPYHHYMRPFWQALEDAGLRDEVGLCSNGVSMVNHTMDYLLSFYEAYPDTPKFALGFISYIAHARPNHLSYGDYDVLSMLTRLTQAGYHNNTVIVLFADHGSRNDDVRNTMQGKLEERLPWLSISVPDWLESKYPDVTAALSHNQHVISSPFDLHATLRHILTYPDVPRGEKAQSLFTKLAVTRECKDAIIDEHWCPCLQFHKVEVNSPEVTKAAQAAVHHINGRLNSSDLVRMSCQQLRLASVHSAMKYEPNNDVQRFSSTNQNTDKKVNFGSRTSDDSHYLVTMETHPMNALFEVTVSIDMDGHVTVNPNISRINKYGSQPKCIATKFPYFRKFCVCKENIDFR